MFIEKIQHVTAEDHVKKAVRERQAASVTQAEYGTGIRLSGKAAPSAGEHFRRKINPDTTMQSLDMSDLGEQRSCSRGHFQNRFPSLRRSELERAGMTPRFQ